MDIGGDDAGLEENYGSFATFNRLLEFTVAENVLYEGVSVPESSEPSK